MKKYLSEMHQYELTDPVGVMYLLRCFEKLRVWRLTKKIIILIRIFLVLRNLSARAHYQADYRVNTKWN